MMEELDGIDVLDWRVELYVLADKHRRLGALQDLHSLTPSEAYGLLLWLRGRG